MDSDVSGKLEGEIGALQERVRRLEEAVRSLRGPLTPPAYQAQTSVAAPSFPGVRSAPVTQDEVPVSGQAPVQASEVPAAVPALAAARQKDRSLESRIGSQWFNRIGILAVLIGMSWFLKLAIDNHWIGPLGRVLIGLLAGAGIIAWSERFQRRNYSGFAYSLKAVGSGILYLSLWAAFSLFHLLPATVAFGAMVLVTAFNGYMAWLQDAELLAVYAIAGGLGTPLLLSTGENHEISLFSYLLLLDLAVLALAVLRPWSRLLFGAFTGTAVFFLGWWLEFYAENQSGRTAFFLAGFFLIFAVAPRLIQVLPHTTGQPSRWDTLALALMPIANAALGFVGFYAIVESLNADWAAPWVAVAFAGLYLLLLRLPARGVLNENPDILRMLQLTLAVVFLTIAIPLKAHGRWLTIGWLMQGAALLWVASRYASRLLRVLALLCLALGLVVLVLVTLPASVTPIFNERFGTYCVAIAVFAFVAWLAVQSATSPAPESEGSVLWADIAGAAVLTVNVLILLAVGWEIHNFWWFGRWRGNWLQMQEYRMYAQFTYSAFFMLFGAILLGVGFWRRSAFLRWQALVLLAVSIGKVFLSDVSSLSQVYRILSFLGLGALLLAVSFVYQRDWLHLRKPEASATGAGEP